MTNPTPPVVTVTPRAHRATWCRGETKYDVEPLKLRARWVGTPPRVGDYLMSPTRPRGAYRVLEVVGGTGVRWDPEHKVEVRRLAIAVDRVPAASVPASARVHPWRWDDRSPRR